jgi:CRP/FNR family transcriptional regulator, cyclic AMP receptor protein
VSTEIGAGAEPQDESPPGPPGPVDGSFLAGLDSAQQARLEEIGVKRDFSAGSVLMFQSETDDRVMILLAGRVKVTRLEHDGRELLLSIRDPGDLLGELAFIGREPRVATVTALEPVTALVLPATVFRRHLEETPGLAVGLLEIVARRFRDATVQRAHFGALDTMGRLAARILELADRYGAPVDGLPGAISFTTPLSREELTAWTGASRAGVAEAFRQLRELGWLEAERNRLVVRDLDALRSRAS